MENIRWAIYVLGRIGPEGNILREDYSFLYVDEKPQHVSDGHFAVQQEFDGTFWNDIESTKIIGEYFENENRTVKCTLNFLQDHTDHQDLNSDVHKGFTIGNGKTLYFMYVWHKSGNATVYSINGSIYGRHVRGDIPIIIHFK